MLSDYSTLDDIATGILIIDSDYRIKYWNSYIEDWTSISSDEILDTYIYDYFPAFNNDSVKLRLEHVFEYDSPVIFSSRLHEKLFASPLRPKTESNVYEVTVTSFRDKSDNQSVAAIFTINNVTDLNKKIGLLYDINNEVENELKLRKEAEKALVESEEKYRLITNNITDFVLKAELDKDDDINITYASPSVFKIRGLTVEEAMAEKMVDIFPPDSLIIAQKIISEKIAHINSVNPKGYEPFTQDFQQYKKDKSLLWVQISGRLVKNISNSKIELVASVRDISLRKEAESALLASKKQLEKQNTEKDKFISVLAHDLVNSLGGAVPVVDLLESKGKDWEDRDMFIKELFNSTRASYNLLSTLVSWGKATLGKESFNLEKIDLFEAFKRVHDLYHSQMVYKNISFVNSCERNFNITADLNMIDAILRNLVRNAIKYTNQQGIIELKANSKEDYTEICVSDNGIGMPDEKAKNLFNLDNLQSNPGTEGETGTGLGLQIVKEYVTTHGGIIWVESELGNGTNVIFKIPTQR